MQCTNTLRSVDIIHRYRTWKRVPRACNKIAALAAASFSAGININMYIPFALFSEISPCSMRPERAKTLRHWRQEATTMACPFIALCRECVCKAATRQATMHCSCIMYQIRLLIHNVMLCIMYQIMLLNHVPNMTTQNLCDERRHRKGRYIDLWRPFQGRDTPFSRPPR